MLGAGSAQHPLQLLEIFQMAALTLKPCQQGQESPAGAIQGPAKPGVSEGIPHAQESFQLCGEQAKALCWSAGKAADQTGN